MQGHDSHCIVQSTISSFSIDPEELSGKCLQYISLLAVPRRLFCFGSLVILVVARCYLWLFLLYINIKIGKNSC